MRRSTESARKHRVPDADIAYAFEHPLAWVEIGDDPRRYQLAGPDRGGNLLELVLLVTPHVELLIHAMRIRPAVRAQLFGEG